MKAYITGTSAITPQHTFDKDQYLAEWVEHEGPYYSVVDPDYRELIDPKMSRRMSRIIRMGIASAKQALAEAQVEQPGAIIVGTGLGCLQDTEKFLADIVNSQEGVLSPTAFIQSTHNTIAGQIAMLLQCPNDNFTYTNRGHSFENALNDALLHLSEGNDHVLVGGSEEIIPMSHKALSEMGCVGRNADDQKAVLGEGTAYFVLSQKGSPVQTSIEDFWMFDHASLAGVKENVSLFLERNQLSHDQIDAVVMGYNGDADDDQYYHAVQQTYFVQNVPIIQFKKVSGEHFTASAYALHLATLMLEKQQVFPHTCLMGKMEKPLGNILIYNHYRKTNHSLILLANAHFQACS